MLLSAFALLAAAPAATISPAVAPPRRAIGPITAVYHLDRAVYCIQSGWNSASFATNRSVRAGDCRTADDWRRRGLAFDAPAVLEARARTRAQVAAR